MIQHLVFALGAAVVVLTAAHAQPASTSSGQSASAGSGQAYPNRPIRLIVPSAPGGSPDISSRMFAPEIARQTGQQLVVDNRSGAGGLLGFEMVAKALPDGYTPGYATFALSTISSLLPDLRFDALRDLQMVMHSISTPNVLAVFPGLPVKLSSPAPQHTKL